MVEIKTTETEKILYKGKIKLPSPDQKPKTKNQKRTKGASPWYVYILQTKRNTLYTGVTNDLHKRMKTHEEGKGSKYVKAKGFKQLLKFKECKNKIEAQQFEYQIKQLTTQTQKLNWFSQNK